MEAQATEVLHSSERKHQRLLGQGNGGRGGPAGCGGHAGGGSGGAGGGRGASSVGFGRGGSGRTAVPVPVTPLATPVDGGRPTLAFVYINVAVIGDT